MYRKQMLIFIIAIPFFVAACLGGTVPTEVIPTETHTSTPIVDLNAVAAQTYTPTSLPTELPKPTATPELAETPLPATATPALPPTENSAAVAPAANMAAAIVYERYFTVQTGTPVGLPNWVHAEAGCNWLGIAGQIFDIDGLPAINFVVEAGGTLEGTPILGLALTGLDSAYGPGGFEIYLADHVAASQQTLWLEVKDTQGKPVSERIYLSTYADCNQNLTLINFIESAELPTPPVSHLFYLPLVFKSTP
ncbi:MAG: hypothetical protein HN413_16540 [Chloroflexi bacterium]|jgi:hypothetical protein|nr:hypothetical protein [Chloroflexota bacterium]